MTVVPDRSSKPDIRLVMLDIDGTLTGSANTVSDRVRQAIERVKQKGVRVGIATGRMYRSARRFHAEIKADMPVCAYQGAMIRHPDEDKTYQHWRLDRSLVMQLMHLLADYPLIMHIYIEDQLYVREWTDLSHAYAERSEVPLNLLADLGSELPAEPTKLLAMTQDTDLINHLLAWVRETFPADQLYLTRSVPTFLEATHPIVNKGNAVKYLAEDLLGLTRDHVLTVGDSDNDIEMLRYAGIGVAMGNAHPTIQAEADWVAPSVDQDGVVAALEEFVL